MTNLERIRNADENELAEILADEVGHGDCYNCPADCSGDRSCHDAWLIWLHNDVEFKHDCKNCKNFDHINEDGNGCEFPKWNGNYCGNYDC